MTYRAGLVLTHGAGSNKDAPLLIALAQVFQRTGIFVQRVNLSFRERTPSGPPLPASAAEDRQSLRIAATQMRERIAGPVFLGGHSYGGRQSSILLAEDNTVAQALLLLSYPLHPPKKPHQLRTAHFDNLRTPVLFVQGTSDPFGSIDEMETALALIPAKKHLSIVEGAGHDLARGRFDIQKFVVEPFLGLIDSSAKIRATGV
jgi:hypothetical protein